MELYHTYQILPSKMSNKLKFLLSGKPTPHFKNYFISTSFAISLNVSSSERKRVVMLMGSVQISLCGVVRKREEGYFSKFQV